MERRCLVYENTTGYLKNHWTKRRHVCTHFDAFSMLIPNMDEKYNNSFFFKFQTNLGVFICVVFICVDSVKVI